MRQTPPEAAPDRRSRERSSRQAERPTPKTQTRRTHECWLHSPPRQRTSARAGSQERTPPPLQASAAPRQGSTIGRERIRTVHLGRLFPLMCVPASEWRRSRPLATPRPAMPMALDDGCGKIRATTYCPSAIPSNNDRVSVDSTRAPASKNASPSPPTLAKSRTPSCVAAIPLHDANPPSPRAPPTSKPGISNTA